MKAAETGLFCVKCAVVRVKVNVIGILIKEYARGRRERMAG